MWGIRDREKWERFFWGDGYGRGVLLPAASFRVGVIRELLLPSARDGVTAKWALSVVIIHRQRRRYGRIRLFGAALMIGWAVRFANREVHARLNVGDALLAYPSWP